MPIVRFIIPLILIASLSSFACAGSSDEPRSIAVDPGDVGPIASTNLREVLGRFIAASSSLDGSRLFEGLLPACEESIDGEACERPNPDRELERFADWLSDRAFHPANLESEQGGELVYRLRSEVVCDGDDEPCDELLNTLAIRLRVSSPSRGDLRIALQLDDDLPLIVRLHQDELGVELDLGELQKSLDVLGLREGIFSDLSGEIGTASRGLEGIWRGGLGLQEDEAGPDGEELDGKFELSLRMLPEARFEATLSILENVVIRSSRSEDLSIAAARAIPALHLHLDEARKSVEVEAAFNRIDLGGPLSTFLSADELPCAEDEEGCSAVEAAPLEGRLAIHLAGLRGRTSLLLPEEDQLQLQGLGFGNEASTISLNGAPLLSLELNPGRGRVVDLLLSREEGVGTTLQVTPALELLLGIQLANLADQLEVPSWALDERFVLRLDGASSPAILFRELEPAAGPAKRGEGSPQPHPSIEVLAGRLSVESKSGSSLEVQAGMCLLDPGPEKARPDGASSQEPDPHPFDTMKVGVCQ